MKQPAYSLLAQAGARVEYEPARGIFVPTALPGGVEAVGGAAGELTPAATSPASYGGDGDKCFACICEDVTTKDLKRAVAEGFDSIELAKRYTTVTMGPCQGKLCGLNSTRLARGADRDGARGGRHDDRAAALGPGVARAPCRPPARAREAHVDPPRPRGRRREDHVDGRLAPAALLRRARPRGASPSTTRSG